VYSAPDRFKREAAILNNMSIARFFPVVLFMIAVQCVVAAGQPAKVRIALAGDSTVTDNAGWGLGFAKSLGDKFEVNNISRGGRASGSFYAEGRWKQILDLKPDYVLIQFGHNDQPGHGADRETDPTTTYRANMTRYVDEAVAAGIKPILVTSISRRQGTQDVSRVIRGERVRTHAPTPISSSARRSARSA
jgi:hypothetical protein